MASQAINQSDQSEQYLEVFNFLREMVPFTAQNYFVDPSHEVVGGRQVLYWNTLLSAFTVFGCRDALLKGLPGTGKTTLVEVVSCLATGLPADLFDKSKILGMPDHTKESMLARLDLGSIAKERPIWQPTLFLPVVELDELNRNTPGKMSIIAEYARTGTVESYGQVFDAPKPAFFATMNYNGAGTYPIPENLMDRCDICLELRCVPAELDLNLISSAYAIKYDLFDESLNSNIREYLLDIDHSIGDKFAYLASCSAEFKKRLLARNPALVIPSGKIDNRKIIDYPWAPEAILLRRSLFAELNQTNIYGDNRREDPQDVSEHNKAFASSFVLQGNQRFLESLAFYAGMLARYMGSDKVEVSHVLTLAPYCLAHRLDFSEEFKQKNKEVHRVHGYREEFNLTHLTVEHVKGNLDNVINKLKLLDLYQGHLADGRPISSKEKAHVLKILQAPAPDHPLFKSMYHTTKEMHDEFEAAKAAEDAAKKAAQNTR